MVRLDGTPGSIISDSGTQFTIQFWKSCQKGHLASSSPFSNAHAMENEARREGERDTQY